MEEPVDLNESLTSTGFDEFQNDLPPDTLYTLDTPSAFLHTP